MNGCAPYTALPALSFPGAALLAQGQLDLLRVVVPHARGAGGHASRSVMSPLLVRIARHSYFVPGGGCLSRAGLNGGAG